jgi:hypothetical protein
LESNIDNCTTFQSVTDGLNTSLTACRPEFTASVSRLSFSVFLPLVTDPIINLQAQLISNGGFSDACRDIDHPNETDTKIPIKTETKLTLVKMRKLLSLPLRLTHMSSRRSMFTAIWLNLICALDTILVQENSVDK